MQNQEPCTTISASLRCPLWPTHQPCGIFVDPRNEKPAINGLQVVRHGDDVVEAEMEARRHADQSGTATKIYCSPYNDLQARPLGACSM